MEQIWGLEQPVPGAGDRSQGRGGWEHHLCAHNVGQVERLLHDGHEGLPQVRGHKHVSHGQQTIRPESLNQEQAVNGLSDGS